MRWFAILALAVPALAPSQVPADRYSFLKWRCIGPYRGGRTVGATGVLQQPNVFYIGVNNGGVWKTNDYGLTWKPIFDDQPTGSIGNLAVAPSNPNIVYVGSGEGLQRPDLSVGDGLYKSMDAGKTWTHLGLRDGQQINTIIVDPTNPDRLFVAVIGHPYAANPERGVFRSLDGGKTFDKVLYKDADTGAVALAFDPQNPNIVYADLWAARMGPWENGYWAGPTSGLYKSLDGGNSWHQLSHGLPKLVGRIGFDVSRSNPKRLFANVDAEQGAGAYRSDDAGESWTLVNKEERIIGRGDDFAEIRIHPQNPDVVFSCNTSTYRSDNGGKDYVCIKGSPGGDDYHTLWINPTNPDVMLLAADQGAAVTVNGGETWSSWYNQPTAQFYHVSTDNLFPYHVMGGQQESGSAMVASRGNDGQITFREWHPVGAEEYGYVAADPLNPDLIYGGKLTRYHKSTGQVDYVRPTASGVRYLRTAPVIFSTVDPHALYFAGNVLFKSVDGANTWQTISPDLSREKAPAPSGSVFKEPARRGVIYTIAPSKQKADTIWVGTDDGLIHITRDGGKTWSNVTPPSFTPWSKVSIIDAGHDDNTAYAAINRIRLDDLKPHIYRTHDGGASWAEIVVGLPDEPVNAVREDPKRPGLLYCATETSVYFSLDDGDHWSSLRQNMPATSIRDLVIHDDDLVVATHGRGFWILDDIAPLREFPTHWATLATFDGKAPTPILFKPADSYLVEWDRNTDTPLPPEEPAGKNPPEGAGIDYWLPAETKVVTLEILNADGKSIAKYSSSDKPLTVDPKAITVMPEWARTPESLSAAQGGHRFYWDMREGADGGGRRRFGGLGMAAIWHDTPFGARGGFVAPGEYSVRLTVDGKTSETKITLKADPRGGGKSLAPPDHDDDGL